MEIDIESEGRDINPPPLEAKINQPSFNRQRDNWVTKSYLLKYFGKSGAGRHHPGYGDGQIEVQEVLQRHARGETIQIADWRKFWKELDTDLKLDTVSLQSPVSESEEQSKEKDQSTGFQNNPRKRHRQDDRSNSGRNNQNSQPRYNTRDDFRSHGRGQRGGIGDYRKRVPANTSNTVVPDLNQRQIGAPIPQLSSETTSSNIIPIPTPSVHQVQLEQEHHLHPTIAVSPPPINTTNIELPQAVDALPDNTTQPINNIVIPQQQPQNQQQLVNQQQQLFNLQSQQFTNQQYRLPDAPDSRASITTQKQSLELRTQQEAQRLHNERILQEYRASNEYRIHMYQGAQNIAQQNLMDGMLMNLEARSKGFDNLSYNPFGNFQPNFNPNQYIDDLSQIPSQDQQEYSNELNQYQMQRDDDDDSNDD
ncbi:MAG: hypothetical protein EZS28_040670, partial [Streblomastix strix]